MKWTHWILYGICLPWDLFVAWPVVLLIRLFWGKDLRWEQPPPYSPKVGGGGGPCLSCQIRPGTFPVTPGIFPKGWYFDKSSNTAWGGTALGHGIFYGPYGRTFEVDWTETQAHEHVHVEQFEVAMFSSLLFGLVVGIGLWVSGYVILGTVLFLSCWMSGYLIMGIAGWITAVLRGEQAYWGATHEESARAQDPHLGR